MSILSFLKNIFFKSDKRNQMISGEGIVTNNKRRVSRNSHKAFYKLKIKEKEKECEMFFWKSNLKKRKWKEVKKIKEDDLISFKARESEKGFLNAISFENKSEIGENEMEREKKPKKYKLKLSYISPSLWWGRSLPINSREWKELRLEVLKRDNYKCSFCGIKSLKYMIVDHISGDARDNSLENLRVNCPMCDTLRHCGLAGIKDTLRIMVSKLDQLEILSKTKEFYLENKRCPLPEEVDPECKETRLAPIEVAVQENEEVPKKWKRYKGFFTEKFNFKFLEFLL